MSHAFECGRRRFVSSIQPLLAIETCLQYQVEVYVVCLDALPTRWASLKSQGCLDWRSPDAEDGCSVCVAVSRDLRLSEIPAHAVAKTWIRLILAQARSILMMMPLTRTFQISPSSAFLLVIICKAASSSPSGLSNCHSTTIFVALVSHGPP
jgi:hypothetical protein